jgi:hypothetical protein
MQNFVAAHYQADDRTTAEEAPEKIVFGAQSDKTLLNDMDNGLTSLTGELTFQPQRCFASKHLP